MPDASTLSDSHWCWACRVNLRVARFLVRYALWLLPALAASTPADMKEK